MVQTLRQSLFIFLVGFIFLNSANGLNYDGRSFLIDYENNQFLKDGEPFRYISGSLHYFRVPNQYWEDRLIKYKAAGLNTVETYIEWALHEPANGTYDFEEDANIFEFIELAQKQDLLVILRPGPYICAERDNGGIPYWLKSINPNMKIRTSDPEYMHYVNQWFDVLMPKLRRYMYENGGPVILVQIENEYGSYGCDFAYTAALRDTVRSHLGNDVVLFTTDGYSNDNLKCGKISGVYATVDFGVDVDAKTAFNNQRLHEIRGPLVNNEFYPGWLDHWLYPHETVATDKIISRMDQILSMNASVNLYMMHGGTSFGFMAGANSGSNMIYQPDPTSYDYDAPISEYGNLTEKYFQIRKLISKYDSGPELRPPTEIKLLKPFKVKVNKLAKNFLHVLDQQMVTLSNDTLTFEALSIGYGYVSYSTQINFLATSPAILNISGLADRAYVYVNGTYQGILSRTERNHLLPINTRPGSQLRIVVENQGRIGFGPLTGELKGITDGVYLGKVKLSNWNQSGTGNWSQIVQEIENFAVRTHDESAIDFEKPKLYRGEFVLQETPADTLLNPEGWGKGVAFINGYNIGRYWPAMGPQVTLYVPGVWLKPAPLNNTLILVNFEHDPCYGHVECQISFTDRHVIDAPTPYK